MASEDLRLQIMMVGGRRCGKTSVLAAMKANFESVFQETGLTISYADLDTLNILEEKNNEISDYFLGENRTFTPDSNPTEGKLHYSFNVGITDKSGKIRVDFVDYPGEWLMAQEYKEHQKELLDEMQKSQTVIIAIDAPHMIEEEGRFNEYHNYCRRTGEMLKMAFEDKKRNHLVLFVPLKCERYFNDGMMGEVKEQTEKSYAELIRYMNLSPSRYEVAVTPIFTMGGAAFSLFKRDSQTREILIDEEFHTPQNAIYYFTDMPIKGYHPKYCEQPLVYLLAYLLQIAGQEKRNELKRMNLFGKLFNSINEWFFHAASAQDYLKHKKQVLKKLKSEGDGYHIIQNPMDF